MVSIKTRIEGHSLMRLKKYRNGLQEWNNKLRKQVNKQMPEILQLGKNKARMVAPVDTGAMINAIRTFKKNQDVYVLQSRIPDNPKKMLKTPYNVIMHKNPTGKNYRGDPQFMYTAAKYMKGIAPKKFRNTIVKLRSEILNI